MRNGKMVETGATADVFTHPKTDYTKALIAARPEPQGRARDGVVRQ